MPDNLDSTWDDLYEEETTAPTTTEEPEKESSPDLELKPLEQIDEEIKPVADSPEELEAAAQVPSDLDADDKKPEPEKPGDAKPETESEKEEEDVKMTGIEQYLSQFDIEGGMISFEDGTSTHFEELAEDKKMEILNQLHQSQASTVEAKYGLDENEIGLINYLRTNKLSVEDMIETMAEERVKVLQAVREVETQNFKEMSDEGVYLQFLKKSNPDATAEQLEGDLEKAKQQTGFDKVATSLRKQLEAEQTTVINAKLREDTDAHSDVIEGQRRQVVDAVIGITDIAGIELNDNIKNGILDKVLEVNEFGDSRFMEEVFSKPDKLFNAAFWYYYGKDLIDQRDNYWKQEKSKAYKRGKKEALGEDSTKISFTDSGVKLAPGAKGKPVVPVSDEEDWLSLHQ